MKNLNKLNYTTDLIGLDMWSFKMRDFYSVASKMFKKDIFTYLEKKPNLKNFNIKKINK